MKYLVIMLSLLVALPTAQAGYCTMGEVQDLTVQPASDGHDCCPEEQTGESGSENPCDDGGHCGACMVVVSAVIPSLQQIAHSRPDVRFTTPLPFAALSHSAPPYRPPIF